MSSKLYLNVGSGQRPFSKPFLNVDVQARWNPDVVANGASMPMFEDNAAEMVVLHHVLEHFGCGEATPVLKECQRVLHPGGTILIFVPDVMELNQMRREGRIDDQVYMTNLYGAYMEDEADRHKWGYTYPSLCELLRSCGYLFPSRFDYRAITGADIAKDRWILGVEAYKGWR